MKEMSGIQKQRSLPRRALLLIVLVAALLGAVWGLGAFGGGDQANAVGGLWTWSQGLPGTSDLQLTPQAQSGLGGAIAISPGIQENTVRRVVPVGTSAHGLILLAADGSNNETCFTVVSDLGTGRAFWCLDSSIDQDAIIRVVGFGGEGLDQVDWGSSEATTSQPDWKSIVGVVRSDVARVTVVTPTGEQVELPLNSWRGFSYSADSPQPFPISVRAYDAGGKLIEELKTP